MMRSSTYSAQIFPLALSPFRLHRPILSPITQTHFVRFRDSFCLRRYLHAAGVNYTLLWSKSEMEAIWETHADFEVAFRQEMGDLLQITHDRIKVFRTYRPCQHFLLLSPAALFGADIWKRHLKRLRFVGLQGTMASVAMGTRKKTGIAPCTARWLSSSYG